MVGTSPPALIPFFVQAIRTLQPYPNVLIDIGCGKGFYGILFKQYNRNKHSECYGFDLNRHPSLDVAYLTFQQVDIEKSIVNFESILNLYINTRFNADKYVINLIEILEHLDKKIGTKLLNILGTLGHPLIITTPTHFYQSNTPETPGAAHKCLWTEDEILKILIPYYSIFKITRIKDTTYRTEHCGIIATNQPLKEIPGGIRDE